MAYDSGMSPQGTSIPRRRTGRWLPVLAVSVLLAPVAGAMEKRDMGPVFEPDDVPVQGIRQPPRAMAEKSSDRIVRDIERRHKAKVVKVSEERDDDGRRVLVMRLVDDKRVKEVRVDAETGKEL